MQVSRVASMGAGSWVLLSFLAAHRAAASWDSNPRSLAWVSCSQR